MTRVDWRKRAAREEPRRNPAQRSERVGFKVDEAGLQRVILSAAREGRTVLAVDLVCAAYPLTAAEAVEWIRERTERERVEEQDDLELERARREQDALNKAQPRPHARLDILDRHWKLRE